MLVCGEGNFAGLTPMDERKSNNRFGRIRFASLNPMWFEKTVFSGTFKVLYPAMSKVGRQTGSQGCSLLSVLLLCCVLRGRACDL